MVYQPHMFDLAKSEERRDIALKRVGYDSDFMAEGLRRIGELHGELTGEGIRQALMDGGLAPHHHNAWGALIGTAVRRKLIEETGQWVKMRSLKANGRRTPVYRVGV